MEPIKKRRNSILKKKPTEEDTTTEFKARRISFSGKKSVKEFIAGEEAETIWGTSYEESADDLKLSSTESGLVNVHVKRIQLRNRRVICEPQQQQQQKRRSSSKKKVLIAENDKENLCVKSNPPPMPMSVEEVKVLPLPPPPHTSPPAPSPSSSVQVEQLQSKSPIKSELAMIKSHENVDVDVVVKKIQNKMPPKKLVVDCSNIFSSTFDFINFSGQINKTITIEQSVDVSLNESELQMFKFRVPVRATEISPNTSNIFCRSILMTEEDVNVLKMVRKEKAAMNIIRKETTDEELQIIESKKRDGEIITDLSKMVHNDQPATENDSNFMEISQIHDGKGSKRKSERTSVPFVMESTLADTNSPLRKKPMHTLYCSSMDVTNNALGKSSQSEPKGRPTIYNSVAVDESIVSHERTLRGRPTIHFDSVVVDESAIGMHTNSETNTLSHTICDSKTVNESSSFPNTTASCLAMGHQMGDISMELSICAPKLQENAQPNSQTLHFSRNGPMEYSLSGDKEHNAQSLFDDNKSKTINAYSDIEQTKNNKKQRESIYTPTDMIEESPKSTDTLKMNKRKGLKLKQTILTTEEKIEDTHEHINPKGVLQKTITTPINIFEDSIRTEPETREIKNDRQSIYQSVDIREDTIPMNQQAAIDSTKKKPRESIYTPCDMVEESPKHSEIKKSSKTGRKLRETTLTAEDLVEDIARNEVKESMQSKNLPNPKSINDSMEIEEPKVPYPHEIATEMTKSRESVYTPSDMLEVSINQSHRVHISHNNNNSSPKSSKTRQTICNPVDIIDDSIKEIDQPQPAFIPSMMNRQTICESANLELSSVSPQSTVNISKMKKSRESINTPSDMIQDSPKFTRSTSLKDESGNLKVRQTIFKAEDIIEELATKNEFHRTNESKNRKTIYDAADIEETTDSVQPVMVSNKTHKSRESIYTPIDMLEESPKCSHFQKQQSSIKDRKTENKVIDDSIKEVASQSVHQKTIKTPIDIFEDSLHGEPAKMQVVKGRQTIYDFANIVEDDVVSIKQPISLPPIYNSRRSISIPSDISIDDLEGGKAIKEDAKVALHSDDSTKSSDKRQTVYNRVDITLDSTTAPSMSADLELKNNQKPRLTINTPTDIEEETTKIIKQRAPSKIQVFRRQLSSTDLTSRKSLHRQISKSQENVAINPNQCFSKIPEFSMKKRQSIHTAVDMMEDSPKSIKQTEPSKSNIIDRKTNYAPSHITIDPINTAHQQTIKTHEDIVTDSPTTTTTGKFLQKKQRQTIHMPVEMMEDSPQPKEMHTRPQENTTNKPEIDVPPKNITDLPFRKPTKLFSEALASSDNPYPSPNSLMNKVMQDMGYAMNFQLGFPQVEASNNKIKEFDPSMNLLSDTQDALKDLVSVDNSMELSIADEKISNKRKHETMYMAEAIDLEVINDMNIQGQTSQLHKTSFDQSLMELSTNDERRNQKEKLDIQASRLLNQLNDKTMNNKSSNLSLKRELLNQKPKSFEEEEASTNKTIGLSIPNSRPILRDSVFSRWTSHDMIKQDNCNTEILQDDDKQSSSKRRTFLFNEDLDVEKIDEVQISLLSTTNDQSQQFVNKIPSSQTMLFNQDLEIEDIDVQQAQSSKSQINNEPYSKSTLCYEDLEQSLMVPVNPQSIQRIEHDKEPRRKTIHLNEDLELEGIFDRAETALKGPLQSSKKINRQTKHLNENIEEIQSVQAHKQHRRQTILMNQDLDLSVIDDLQKVSSQILPQNESNRRTVHINQDLDIDDSQKIVSNIIPKRTNRQTIHFNEDLEIEDKKPSVSQCFKSSNQSQHVGASKRQTILVEQEIDMTTALGEQSFDLKSDPKSKARSEEQQTTHFNEGLEIEDQQHCSKVSNKLQHFNDSKRQTIHVEQEIDIEELFPQNRPSKAEEKQSTYFHQELDKENASPRRKTLHLNEDLEYGDNYDRTETSFKFPLQNLKTCNRQTLHLNEKIEEVEKENTQEQALNNQQTIQVNKNQRRESILMNQDLDLSEIVVDLPKVSPQIPLQISKKINQQSDHSQEYGSQNIFHRSNGGQTIHFNQDLEFEDQLNSPWKSSKLSNKEQNVGVVDSKRQTILVSQNIDMTIPPNEEFISQSRGPKSDSSCQENRHQTTYFHRELELDNQNITDEESSNLQHKIESDDEYAKRKNLFNETKKNTEVNAYRFPLTDTSKVPEFKSEFISLRNPQTIHFIDNNMDESVEATGDGRIIAIEEVSRKPSSRVTIYQEQPLNMDETFLPKSCAHKSREVEADFEGVRVKVLSKPRRVTICEEQPLDMDESLLPSKSTARKSSFSRNLNFDEPPTTSTSIAKSRVTWQSSTSEDDISPIFNPNSRQKVPMTPSEVDRSLADYLKVEAAIDEQEEEIFYDAEDGTENQKQIKRQTCHVPIDILEVSGMQPLQSESLKRQTTFSPKAMTNESIYDGRKSREIDRQTVLDKEQTLGSPLKRFSQMPLVDSNNTMEVSHIETKSKHIVMEPSSLGVDVSKTTNVQKNRQTLHFNETINTSDVSMAWNKPRTGVQSIKKLLAENTRLFSQSNLMEPSVFEPKRSTIFFAGKDNSMDVSCIGSGPPTDPETTPTKNKISRIPQLIGSAKKLESLKKSMEFIQQELPNIGSHLRNQEVYEIIDDSLKEQETPRRFSTSIPKILHEVQEESFDSMEMSPKPILSVTTQTIEQQPLTVHSVRQLNESFDTIEIPRKVLSSIKKTIEEPARELTVTNDADEIYRRTINIEPPAVLQDSFDTTVEIPRRATTFQRNDTLYICPNEMETTTNASQKSLFQFEDAPITISDVSTFFSQKLQLDAKQATTVNSPKTIEALCKENVNEFQGLPRSPDAGDTTHNLADFKKRYVELTCDSLELSDSKDAIEKTHLSLVNTLDDESEMVYCPPEISVVRECRVPLPHPPSHTKEQQSKPNSSVCRKCKCRRLSTTINETTIGSFMLEQLPVYKIDLSELANLKKKPNISDVGKVWRQKLRESDSFNVSDGSRSMAMDDEDSESIQKLLMELADERLENEKQREQNRKEIQIENSFVYKVRRKMQSETNWIINELLLFNNIIVLTHTRIRTFAIVINFTPKDPRGVEVIFNDIQFKTNKLHTHQRKPFEYALHYQLLVELPFDLKTICPTSEHFFELLEHVEKVIEEVLKTGKEMLSLILPSPALLIREPSGRVYIRKYVRTKTPQNDVKRTEVHIEVRNIKKLSYESITMPPLYEFDESIQLLPVGNEFLRIFLHDPLRFMKI